MSLKNQLKKLITGLTVPQEYTCLGYETVQPALSVFLTSKSNDILVDVTKSHLFLGYKPLVLGLLLDVKSEAYDIIETQNQICLSFGGEKIPAPSVWRGYLSSETSIARLRLKKIQKKTLGEQALLFYKGEYGEHLFLSPAHQFINQFRAKFKKHAPNNVDLPGNLADQVRIAYALPRIISMITVCDGDLINMFPTDLHGPIGDSFYAGSLRKGGLACHQIEKYKLAVISEVELSTYKQTYSLGKNHMRELREIGHFLLHEEKSKVFNFPLPEGVIRYREVKQIDFFDCGIHRIHLYEVVHRQEFRQDSLTLAHIHQYYAQWRLDRGLRTPILFR